MARRPCSATGHLYAGPAQWAYPAAIEGGEKWSARLPLCGTHFRSLQEEMVGRLEPAQEEMFDYDPEHRLSCAECGISDMRCELAVFATLYPRGEERLDYFGVAHRSCLDALRTRFLIDSQFAA